eukprot:54130_1
MSRQADNALIASNEVVADDIALAEDPHNDQTALVTPNGSMIQKLNRNLPNITICGLTYWSPKFDEIQEFLENEEGLDIYQLVAFRIKSGHGCCTSHTKYNQHDQDKSDEDTEDTRMTCCGYWNDIFKALICCFTQFSTIIVLYFYVFDSMKEETEKEYWCDATSEWSSKMMAISYAFFLSLIFHLNRSSQKIG